MPKPERVSGIDLDADDDAAIQRMFTPERLAQIERADAEIDAGNFLAADQVDDFFKAKRAAYLARHAHAQAIKTS